jgi:hypothetical protein
MIVRLLLPRKAVLLYTLLFFCLMPDILSAQGKMSVGVHLKSTFVKPINNARVWTDSLSHTNASGYAQVLLQFSVLPDAAQRDILRRNGIRLLDHIPDNAFTAVIKLPFTGSMDGLPVTAVINIADEWKADKNVWAKINANAGATVAVMVTFDTEVPQAEIQDILMKVGAVAEKDKFEAYGLYKVIIEAKRLRELAHSYAVKYISPVATYANADVDAKATSRANIANQPVNLGGYGLLGDSVTVGVGDDVAAIYHIDMQDRVINYNPVAIRHHGVFTNGVVSSAGIVDPLAEGMAPHARLVNHLYDNVLQATPLMYHQYNMSITNNSYVTIEGNCGYSGTYDAYAQFIDNLTLQYPYVFHVFAAGNDGYLNCTPYPKGYGTVAGGYQTGKNELVVTSTDKDYNIAYDASRGPVLDGRLKPELTAVGYNDYSCIDITGYEFASGTSFASPQAAGAAALLTQRYKATHIGTLPASDLLKAVMLAGAIDAGNPGPDFTFGYGFMNVQHSLQILDSNYYYTNAVANGAQQTITIKVPPNTGKLKVMLYWNDQPASPLAAKQLVNDLDLLVQTPGAVTHKPFILDPTPANVNNDAVEGEDHLNNSEEVIISNPQAGSYTVTVTGYHVASPAQQYVVAYDLEPAGINLSRPIAGTKAAAGRIMYIYWEAPDATNSYALQYSTNNGNTWLPIASAIPANQLFYDWKPDSTLSSGQCQVKLTRNNTNDVSISETFVINPVLVVQLDAAQCPGYVNIHWAPIPNATAYQVLRKKGPYMQVVDTTIFNAYSFNFPVYDSTYYVAVSPIINGLSGYRSNAIWRKPVDGTCAGFPSGDLAVTGTILRNGRQFTSTQLTNTQIMVVTLQNRYTSPTTSYSLAYSVNGGVWSTLFSPPAIPADSAINVSLPGLQLGTPGTYTIKVAVHNIGIADPIHQNDTLVTHVTNIPNPIVSLTTPFIDGFEDMSAYSLTHDSIGISPNGHWDFRNSTDTGRLRTFVDSSINITGNRSISMDAYLALPGNQNYFDGTFNLSNYDTATTEVRLGFDYVLHGTPKNVVGNQLWARGVDTKNFVNLYNYDITAYPGTLLHSGSLSLTDLLLHSGQNFSASTQVRFGQNDTSLIAAYNYGNGVTLDNFTLYTVQNDVQLVSIVGPQRVNCGLGSNTPLTVQLYNGVKQAQTNIQLYYQLDGGTVYHDFLLNLQGKDTVSFTFSHLMDVSATGKHTLNVYIANGGDTYTGNDSVLNYTFYNQPLITSFPYLENFEAGPGNWFTDGQNNSWQYGTPASPKIHKAASGTKAWKTNLTGTYNNLETSYLFSPCFDVSQMASPMLSFSTAMDIENCGSSTLCDAGYMEYSYDGVTWTKLGASGQGTNWYGPAFNVWNTEGNTRWHVASIPLPASTQPIRLRFVLKADPGATFEGIAVDDVHIFDRTYSIFGGQTPFHVSASPAGSIWQPVTGNNSIIASVNANGQTPGALGVGVYNNYHYTNTNKTQYIFPRNFTVKATQKSKNSLGIRLFVTDDEMLLLLADTVCASCSRPEDVYTMGVSKYDNTNTALENGTLDDNAGGIYTFYPYTAVKWVPYDNGYYAEFGVGSFSEFWFSDGGPNHAFSIGDDYLVFDAQKTTTQQVKVNWLSYIDTLVNSYILQRSMDGTTFSAINTVTALHQPAPKYVYNDTPAVALGSSVYYRLLYHLLKGDSLYSPTRRVDWTDGNELLLLYPNPTQGQINIQWTATPGTLLQLQMVDETGRQVAKQSIATTQWNNLTTLQTPRFANGVYFMKIILGSHQYVKKIVYE